MLGITGKGIGGLATGLNTDELVAALTSGTKAKIAKQGQQKQLLNWKMTAYRSMASALSAFQTKSLKGGTTGTNTNITSSNFFNTYKATSSSSKVSVSTTSNSIAGNFTINKITQLAEAESYKSVKNFSSTITTNLVSDKVLEANAFTGKTLTLEATGFSTKTIKLDDLNGKITTNGDGSLNLDEFQKTLQGLVDKAYAGSRVVDVTIKDGQIMLDSKSAKVTVGQGSDVLGLGAGKSNRVDTNTKLGSLNEFAGLQGDSMTFKINGTEITVSKNDTIEQLKNKISNSNANVRMEYDQQTNEFKLISKSTGADSKIEMQDLRGNFLNEIFGAQGGNAIGTGYLTSGNSFASLNKNTIDGMTDAQRKALINELDGMSFDMTVNGVTKTVKLDVMLGISAEQRANGKYTSDDVYKAINVGVQNAFWNSGIEFSGDKGYTVISTPNGDAISADIKGKLADYLGVSGGMTNIVSDYGYKKTIETNSGFVAMDSLWASVENPNGLSKDNPTTSFEMTINGVTETITVSLSERAPTDKEKAADEAKLLDDPDYVAPKYYNTSADSLVANLNKAIKAKFGDDAVSFSASYEYSKQSMDDLKGVQNSITSDGDGFKIDGQSIKDYTDNYGKSQEDLIKELKLEGKLAQDKEIYVLEYNATEKGEDGNDKTVTRQTLVDKDGYLVDYNGNRLNKEATDFKLTLNTNDTGKVATKSVSMSGEFVKDIGFNVDGNNEIKNSTTGAGVTLSGILGASGMGSGILTLSNGEEVSYNKDMTLQDFLTNLNKALGESGSAGIRDGKLFIESSGKEFSIEDSNAANGMLKNIFGISGGKYETKSASFSDYDKETGKGTYRAGKNAELEINGVKMAWSSNTISYNNTNITITDVSNEAINVNVQSDPDDVIKRIQEWMDDYNALVYTLNSALNESKNGDYAPLTDEQKEGMTQDQIKTWEAEAKKGILRSDQTLRGILSDMRTALYQKVESAGISLFDIGIVTKSGLSDPNEAGQLEFDKTIISSPGEERLRQMLTNNPDKVRMLFADPENGIGVKLNGIINRAVETSSIAEKRGTLVRIAGTDKLTGDNTSQLGKKITALDTYIATLKARMESEYTRYWKKFSSLETAVQKMNSQSSWLQSQ